MNLDIINQINQSVAEETKEVKAEEIKEKERVLEKNVQTSQKIEQERAVLTSDSKSESGFGLNKAKEVQDIFKKSSGSSLDSLFDTVAKEEKKTTTTTSSGYGYNYSTSTAKKEETQQDKAREFANGFTKKAAERAKKEWLQEEEHERNSWNIFELQEKAEEERKQTRTLTQEDKRKLQSKDILKKSILKGLVSTGKGIIESLYTTTK
jgi:glucan-binding YG repeat protein